MECSAIDYADLTLTGEVTRPFERGDGGLLLEHGISVYSDEGEAIEAVERGDEESLAECLEEAVEAPVLRAAGREMVARMRSKPLPPRDDYAEGRRGRRTSSPPQFGHVASSASVHVAQNVHS